MTARPSGALKLPVVDFLDTSVLVEILQVPGKSQRHQEVVAELSRRQGAGVRFVLPTATIVETGNHVFQVKDGNERRTCAEGYARLLRATADGQAPWVLHERVWDGAFLATLRDGGTTGIDLVGHAGRRLLGTGDLSIVAERDLYASRAMAQVRIWTLEATMQAWAGA